MLGGLRLLAVAVLTLVSLVVKADEKTVQVDINTFENGTVVEKSQSDPDAEGSVTVTITATPAEGYQISAADITVKATAAPGSAETRSGIQIGDLLEVSGPAEAQTGATDYTFVVPQGLGAIVESVLFREVEKPQVPMSFPLSSGPAALQFSARKSRSGRCWRKSPSRRPSGSCGVPHSAPPKHLPAAA